MDEVYICELCLREFGPKEVKPGVLMLQRFKGYTVDVQLQEFRNINRHQVQFIAFASPKGKALLAQMHEEVTR